MRMRMILTKVRFSSKSTVSAALCFGVSVCISVLAFLGGMGFVFFFLYTVTTGGLVWSSYFSALLLLFFVFFVCMY